MFQNASLLLVLCYTKGLKLSSLNSVNIKMLLALYNILLFYISASLFTFILNKTINLQNTMFLLHFLYFCKKQQKIFGNDKKNRRERERERE